MSRSRVLPRTVLKPIDEGLTLPILPRSANFVFPPLGERHHRSRTFVRVISECRFSAGVFRRHLHLTLDIRTHFITISQFLVEVDYRQSILPQFQLSFSRDSACTKPCLVYRPNFSKQRKITKKMVATRALFTCQTVATLTLANMSL